GPPYPDDLDAAPPEQWRPAAPARQNPASAPRSGGGPGNRSTGSATPPTAHPAARPEDPRTATGAAAPAPTANPAAPAAPAAPQQDAPSAAPAGADRNARLSFRERHAAAIAAGRKAPASAAAPQDSGVEWDDSFVPSSDDEALEDSTLYGRAAIERILGGMLIEERDLHTGE
ncbi:DNA polymerase III subunit gamma and tau, partial [Kocuria rosea]|nr:DNA polymerase III subunit gamma and tau [Kocuria rosea]